MKNLNTDVKIETATIITPTTEVINNDNNGLMDYYASLYELLKTNASGQYSTINQN